MVDLELLVIIFFLIAFIIFFIYKTALKKDPTELLSKRRLLYPIQKQTRIQSFHLRLNPIPNNIRTITIQCYRMDNYLEPILFDYFPNYTTYISNVKYCL